MWGGSGGRGRGGMRGRFESLRSTSLERSKRKLIPFVQPRMPVINEIQPAILKRPDVGFDLSKSERIRGPLTKRIIKHVKAFCGRFDQWKTRQDLITARFTANPGPDYLFFSGHSVCLTPGHYAIRSRG